MRTIALLIALLLAPAFAETKPLKPTQFEDGKTVVMNEAFAYLLLKTYTSGASWGPDFVFVRTLDYQELIARKEKNVLVVHGGDTYAEAGALRTYVLAVKPGTYVFAEQASGFNGTAVCMGSVKFEAKAGVLTDLGTVLAARDDKPSDIAELAPLLRGKMIVPDYWWFVMTIRPPSETDAVPDGVKTLPRVLADYRAVNRFPNYFGAIADRLMPIPGILGYDAEGNVLDLKANAPAEFVAPPAWGAFQ